MLTLKRIGWENSSGTCYRVSLGRNSHVRHKHEWILPSGHDTGIKVYNRIKNENVPLIFVNKNLVKWYICGPTVYDVSHVGHASSYVRFDIVRRILDRYFDVKPIVALGLTDIDDKIIKKSRDENVDFKTLAKRYDLEFFEDLKTLNVLPPAAVLRVSEHIPVIIEFIRKIIDKKNAYVAQDGSVYLDTKTLKSYGKLVHIQEDQSEKTGKEGRKCSADFALWKASKPGEPFWECPWGKGRPGWHIECSAMSSRVFGSYLDMHSGGVDLLFPHHENEEAQSCSYHGCDQWVNYWVHSGTLMVNEEKMSKSLSNFVSIKDFLESNHPNTFRMFCFITQYRNGLHYCPDSIQLAADACERILKFLGDCNCYVSGNWARGIIDESELLEALNKTDEKIRENLMDDFNTAACFVDLMNLVRTTVNMLNKESPGHSVCRSPDVIAAVSQFVKNTFESFGFAFSGGSQSHQFLDNEKINFVIDSTVKFRQAIREEALSSTNSQSKKIILTACDTLRTDLASAGIHIKDQSKSLSSWSRIETHQRVNKK